MKKLLLIFTFLLLSSSSIFAETYSCDGASDGDGTSTILTRQGPSFSYNSLSNNGTTNMNSTLKIVNEDSTYLFLMGNISVNGGSTVVAINKISNVSSSIYISPRLYGSSGHFESKCTKR